jgi:hypothetical protein
VVSRSAAKSAQDAQATVSHLPASRHRDLNTHVTNAFIKGLHRGCIVAAGAALVVAVLVLTHLLRAAAPESRSAPAHVKAPLQRPLLVARRFLVSMEA